MIILIVEDESRSAKRLERLLQNENKDKDFNIFWEMSLTSAIKFLESNEIDLLFLDLNLKGADGFELLKQIVSDSFHTIVVSAHIERAVEAFDYGVLDFMPKPIIAAKLKQALERFYGQYRTANLTKYLTVKHKNHLEQILVSDILFLHSKGHYTEIHTTSQSVRLHNKSLEKLLMILPPQFERSHKSYIINMDYMKKISSFSGSVYKLELEDNIVLPLSRTKARHIKNILLNF